MSIISEPIVQILLFLTNTIESIGLPYPFGFGIIVLTILLKIITYPLSLKQIRSMKAMQALQPRMAELQKKYGKDRERMAQEQMKMYREAGVNPLGGCLPLLVQLPILWALFGALRHPDLNAVSNSAFFFIRDLHCPSCAEWPQGGTLGIGWLWPFPPAVGWEVALPYLVLPVLLFGTQILMQRYTMMMTPSTGTSTPNMSAFNMIFSVMFSYYTLILPASLSVYYITFNLLTVAQQYLALRADGGKPALAPAAAVPGQGTSPLASLPTPKPAPRPQTEPAVQMEVQSNSDDDAADEQHEKAIRRSRRRRRK